MADDTADKRQRSKKKRSSLLTWKKKFNIKKRFTNKLPVHRRHIRALMSGWSLQDIRSVLMQYEITSMLKELSSMADKSRPQSFMLGQDLTQMFKTSSCWDMVITCCELSDIECSLFHSSDGFHKEFKVHRFLVSQRWPYLRHLMKEQLPKRTTFPEKEESFSSMDLDYSLNEPGCGVSSHTWNIHICGLSAEKLEEILNEIYNGKGNSSQQSNPRKLLPLPTTDDSLHIRNSKGHKHNYRYTIIECEQPPVTRRNVVRRKQKHRFSMDERILTKQHLSPTPSRVYKVCPADPTPGDILPSSFHQNELPRLYFENRFSNLPSKTVLLNSLQDDVLRMYHDTKSGSGDLKIIISTDLPPWTTTYGKREDIIYCHKVVLASRSPYFRRLIEKQASLSIDVDSPKAIQTLELEGNIIPSKYMLVALYAMYTDKVDLFQLNDRTTQSVPLSNSFFNVTDVIRLHHIGRFIEFPKLVYGCEELIVNNLDEKNLLQVLHWTYLPHGSDWVRRQVNNFIRERFTELLGTEVLFKLSASQIIEVLNSDFVNASELDILKCALKWGEQELHRRIEESEPNLLTHTAHSISRNKTASARRRELLYTRIEELHECTAPVLACVRTQHLLPPNHEIFANAVKRGVISMPPTDLLENVSDKENCSRQWVKSRADFVPPRLFQPYMDETKNILDERYALENDCVSLRSMHSFSQDMNWGTGSHQTDLSHHGIPDTLYMVNQSKVPTRRRYGNRDLHLNFMQHRVESSKQKNDLSKFIGNYHPVPDISVVRDMMVREREMRSTRIVNKVLRLCADCCHSNSNGFAVVSYAGRPSIPQAEANTPHVDSDETENCNRCTALRLVRLYIVREQGLPDCAVDLLQHPEMYYTIGELRGVTVIDTTTSKPSQTVSELSSSRTSGATLPVETESFETSIQQSLIHENSYSKITQASPTPPPPYKNPPDACWEKSAAVSRDPKRDFNHCSSSPLNKSPPQGAHSLTDSTSSSDEEEMIHIRRRKISLSRKSSSTTSYQSIPDVAASANSSLQRLRGNTPKLSKDMRDSPLVIPECRFRSPNEKNVNCFVDYNDTETCDSSSSSFEENTTENENDSAPNCHRPVNFSVKKAQSITPHSSSSRVAFQSRSTKLHPRRHPLSSDMSELFSSALDFIDDHPDSSDDNLGGLVLPKTSYEIPQNAKQLPLNVPELVKDGTLPHPNLKRVSSKSSQFYDKPDIYPLKCQQDTELDEQCGKYFLCSLTRDKMSNSKSDQSVLKAEGSFAIPLYHEARTLLSKFSDDEKETEVTDNDTIFL